jgi:hypothetical protein
MDPAITPTLAKAAVPLTAKLIAKVFPKEGRGAGLVDAPMRISSLISLKGEKQNLTSGDVQKLTYKLVKAAIESAPHEYSDLEDEAEAVAGALSRTVLALGEITMSDIQAIELGHEEFARELRKAAPDASSDLSSAGESLYESLLDICCLYILNFFTQRSAFIQRTQVEHSRRIAHQSRQIATLLSRIPDQNSADLAFEDRYAEAVRAEHGRVRIFGLDLDRSRGRGWDLDAAYLNLEANGRDWAHDQAHEADGEIRTQRVDKILSDKPRVLLRGQAGAGKSTLIQWLAVSSAFGSFTDELAELNFRVPFVLRMRKMSRQGVLQPRPAQFLAVDDNLRADSQPDGWADRVLRSGRALLLVDGMDEVSATERDEAHEWLERLLALYPQTRTLVTARPAAVPVGWLEHLEFEELSLRPMSAQDRRLFIERWHNAALVISSSASGSLEAERERHELMALQESLLRSLEVSPDLSALTDSPLLCAMICALHREWDGSLPKRRMDVYRAALSMLLVRRDQQRRVKPSETIIGEEEQLAILQRIASWLVINEKAEGERNNALGQIRKLLPSLPDVGRNGNEEQIFTHLVNRTGLLRETSLETFDFIHRTFQDYLAAKEFKEERNFGLLSSKADSDQWADVIRMAVGHCDPIDRANLLGEIVRRAEGAEDDRKRRINLLLGTCLTYASRLDSEVRAQVLEAVESITPPRRNEADQWAMIGEPVLPLLRKYTQGGNFATWLPDIATRAAGNEALPYLRELVRTLEPNEVNSVLMEWPSYDAHRFAEDVLSGADLSQCTLAAETLAQLREVPGIGRCSVLRVDGDFRQEDIDQNLSNLDVSWLVLSGIPSLSDLSFLSSARDLNNISIFDSPNVQDLSALSATGVEGLYINNVGRAATSADVASIAHEIAVQILGVHVTSLSELDSFPANPAVRRVLLYDVTEYSEVRLILQAFPSLKSLYIGIEDATGPLDLRILRGHSIEVQVSASGLDLEILGEELVVERSHHVDDLEEE